MSGIEREPLTITLPSGATEITVHLVAAHCEPLAVRATEQEARQLCEGAERATIPAADLAWNPTLAWHPTDESELTHELYVVLGDECRTEYTVTPITVRTEPADRQQPPLPAPDHDGDRLTIALLADIKAVLERHGYRLPADTTARHRAIAETLAVLGFLGKAFEGHAPQADPATARWNDAIDWLLNSRWTADPDIQAAFWGVVDGRCTVEEADAGHLADGTPLTDPPEEGADDE